MFKKMSVKLKTNQLTLRYLSLILLFEKTEIIWANLALIQIRVLKTFVSKKNIGLNDNENLKENHLGIKKLLDDRR